MANSLKKSMMKKLENGGKAMDNISSSKPAPPPILPKQDFEFLDLDPIECARQICLAEQQMFRNISLREFLDQKWMKENKE
eukprot:CAMPEP_0201500100 /NCGR_PEP_ID=MMETSP0151_2-20130828/79793_1 /ASSEMBLY_ACC=CAM_ASM_000257 /TAXON_ID=200890 /ORGANISM="Paramoeba atlantica, Strain 621/1 / CCAP 1560/9" /LENGTH=80 /DNA_ID=CAMNT_0047893041 /DNA_START=32 /DNA_END=271 /DNA_ORIENTATION=+